MRSVTEQLLESDPVAPGKRRITPSLWPDPLSVNFGSRGDLSEFSDFRTLEPLTYSGEWEEKRFVDASSDVIGKRMELDDRIVVLGEDVHRLGGGTNGVT